VARVRLLDTGRRAGRANVALDQTLIEAHRAGLCPDTLRFLAFSPSALIGRHQDLSREIDLDYCRARGIDVGRRVTGGGAIYLDEGQLGWELIVTRARAGGGALAAIAARLCTAAAAGLARLGVEARFRPRNDIEVGGRKIGGTGGFFDGDTLFYQGTVLIDLDPETMFRVLRVPGAKRARHGDAEPAARVTSLSEALGGRVPAVGAVKDALAAAFAEQLGLELVPACLAEAEEAAAAACARDEIGHADFVHAIDGVGTDAGLRSASRDTPGGIVTVHLKRGAGPAPHLESILITGDFFVTPPRVIPDLECALRQAPVAELADAVRRFLATAEIDLLSVPVADLIAVIEAAAQADAD
jgi:lipoate-protein ligase A